MHWTKVDIAPAPSPLPGLYPQVAAALIRRGLTEASSARAFLDPSAWSPTTGMELPGMSPALYRIGRAIRLQEPICVWGDFDADGQTSTSILVEALRMVGAVVTWHIPIRSSEGHGIKLSPLSAVINGGAKLIITCDTGISAANEVEFARSHGVEMVVTDHHELPEALPQATAVVNPKLLPADHPLATLSGAGVAYKLVEALFDHLGRVEDAPHFLDLAALGLVADVSRLVGDTRYLVQRGLSALRSTDRLGLQLIMELAEMNPANLTEEHIGFVIGPRLNALGRLGNANPAVELLTTSDHARARMLASQLENYNAQRQLLCSQVKQAAEAQLHAEPGKLEAPILILNHPAWPASVVGIVASHLVERYSKPAILFSTPAGEPARGSARSVEGFNITAAISAHSELLLNYGGHPMAAGLSLESANLPEFTRRICVMARKTLPALSLGPQLTLDGWLTLPEVNLELAEALDVLAPFGPGNEKLVLGLRELTLRSSTEIGHNHEHLKLVVADGNGNSLPVLWWDGAGEPLPDGKFDLACTVHASDFQGNRHAQVEFVDFRAIETNPVELKSNMLEVVDYRQVEDPYAMLKELQARPNTLTWAEADARQEVGGRDRNELKPAEGLIIWTMPPSPEVLRQALETVHPHQIYLLGAHPPLEVTESFLARLTGLLKYIINQREGRTTYRDLAAATAQRVSTVEQGLNYLVTCGKIILKRQEKDQIWLAPGVTINDLGGAARLRLEVHAMLAETTAYRQHFKNADPLSLLP